VTFQIDRAPSIEMIEGREGGLAKPLARVKFAAEDDLAVPHMTVHAGNTKVIDVTAEEVSRTLDLSTFEGQVVTLSYTVLEPSRPQFFKKETQVLSLSNPRYQEIVAVPGWIFDARGGEVLYTNANAELVKEGPSGTRTVLATDVRVGSRFENAALITPTGALIWEGAAAGDRVREIRNGTLIDHGPGSGRAPIVKGNFGLIQTDQRMWRDFANDTNIAIEPAYIDAVLGENGTFFLTSTGNNTNEIFRFSDGQVSALELEAPGFFRLEGTDGTNLIYLSATTLGERFSVYVRTPTETIQVSTNYSQPGDLNSARPLTLIHSGWTAFPRLTDQGHQQIWLRSPEGEITQATFYSRSSVLRALSASGDLVTVVTLPTGSQTGPSEVTQVIYTPLGGMPKEISADFGARYFFEGETLYAYWGGTLFRVITEGEPIGITAPQYDAVAGELSYYVTSSEAPADFTLQRTTDFEEWTDVFSGTVTNTLPTRFESATSAGYFRLQKGN
jgi:hypothetical protein